MLCFLHTLRGSEDFSDTPRRGVVVVRIHCLLPVRRIARSVGQASEHGIPERLVVVRAGEGLPVEPHDELSARILSRIPTDCVLEKSVYVLVAERDEAFADHALSGRGPFRHRGGVLPPAQVESEDVGALGAGLGVCEAVLEGVACGVVGLPFVADDVATG